MKKIFICFSLTLNFVCNAQYTLTSSSNPVPGDIESYYLIDTNGITVSGPGAGQSWNYNSISLSFSLPVSSYTYVPVSAVPFNSLFPGATVAQDAGGGSNGNYGMYEGTSSGYSYLGSTGPTFTDCVSFSNKATFYSLPFTLGTISNDTYSLSAPQFSATESGTITTVGDASGTLQLLGTTYPNVIRMRFQYSYSGVSAGNPYSGSSIENRFYSSFNKFPLFTITTSTLTSGTSPSYYKQVMLNSAVPTGIYEIDDRKAISIYPNPASSDYIYLSIPKEQSEKIQVRLFNVIGQEIDVHCDEINTKLLRADVKELTTGVYFIKVNSDPPTRIVIQ